MSAGGHPPSPHATTRIPRSPPHDQSPLHHRHLVQHSIGAQTRATAIPRLRPECPSRGPAERRIAESVRSAGIRTPWLLLRPWRGGAPDLTTHSSQTLVVWLKPVPCCVCGDHLPSPAERSAAPPRTPAGRGRPHKVLATLLGQRPRSRHRCCVCGASTASGLFRRPPAAVSPLPPPTGSCNGTACRPWPPRWLCSRVYKAPGRRRARSSRETPAPRWRDYAGERHSPSRLLKIMESRQPSRSSVVWRRRPSCVIPILDSTREEPRFLGSQVAWIR